ncbi:hypothetical protein J2J97_27985 (plasmid) [Rhizobium bangladeshense]|uniref:hypothetical protein n=1 Tax=Rhizobium bangladeshense TaxID=1138189 RepID=UPI001A98D9C1|nr:hypothetical protein [Rhizobium bangladeshense]QSY97960.1 hypothetical protein J2J97_27985 [Rhizobium bangladeshense]
MDAAEQAALPTSATDVDVSNPEHSPAAIDETETEVVLKDGGDAIVSSTGMKRAKRLQKPGSKQQTSTARLPDEPQPVPPARPAFLDEVITLDSEIADLRAALAQKLKLQNAQLRRMLARFDVR